MYSNKLVACIKVGDKILREENDCVYLPFGSEYSIYLKNEHTKKVGVTIEIDGININPNSFFIINPKEKLDINSFIENKRKFKFIEKSDEISNYRADKIEDGIVKISFIYEEENSLKDFTDKIRKPFKSTKEDTPTSPFLKKKRETHPKWPDEDTWKVQEEPTVIYSNSSNIVSNEVNESLTNDTFSSNYSTGITVSGSLSKSEIETKNKIFTGKEFSLLFNLKGFSQNNVVEKEVTMKDKKICTSCGKKFKINYNYCPFDGTYLQNQ